MTNLDFTPQQAAIKFKRRCVMAAASISSIMTYYLTRPGADPTDRARIVFTPGSPPEFSTPPTEEDRFQANLHQFFDQLQQLIASPLDAIESAFLTIPLDALELAQQLFERQMPEVAVELASQALYLVQHDLHPQSFINLMQQSQKLLFDHYREQGKTQLADFYEVEYLRSNMILNAFASDFPEE